LIEDFIYSKSIVINIFILSPSPSPCLRVPKLIDSIESAYKMENPVDI
jgi:hypothetical protein